ncbi:MAG: prepilin-type N-terminal cleavage/methylation domain-containing protein [Candidatus Acidiferrales bacterium]
MQRTRQRVKQKGFTLVETMVALAVLGIGLVALAAMLASSIAYMNSSQADFIAQQKASEAIESIFTARDTQAITFSQIQNVAQGGIFQGGAQTLVDPGPDGVVDTADDLVNSPDTIIKPGPDGILGTADDIQIQLSVYYNMRRTIVITPIVGVNNVRMITVTVTYTTGSFNRSYTLTSYISQFS